MELTDQETSLINAIREIDRVNPIGADGYSSSKLIPVFLNMANAWITSAKKAHALFLEESKNDRFIDLEYYRASRYEDGKHIKKRG